jgi:hypothetical protein
MSIAGAKSDVLYCSHEVDLLDERLYVLPQHDVLCAYALWREEMAELAN